MAISVNMDTSDILYYDKMHTPIGALFLAGCDKGLRIATFNDFEESLSSSCHHAPDKLQEVVEQLQAYFAGQLKTFSLQLFPQGTSFQLKVWEQLRQIPHGKVITYGELAKKIDNPKASRAVGNANGRNPLVIIQPCHRVVGADDKLGGFSSGLHRKEFLLKLERGGRIF